MCKSTLICSSYEQRLWRENVARYRPGNRLACYQFISWHAACESAAYWAQHGDPPPDPAVTAYGAARLADLFKATKWRRR